MINYFREFISNLLDEKYFNIGNVKDAIESDSENEKDILKALNLSFLVLLAGNNHPLYKSSKKILTKYKDEIKADQIVDYFNQGADIISDEIKLISKKKQKLKQQFEALNNISRNSNSIEQIVEVFWSLFFNEGCNLFDNEIRKEKVLQLKEKRKVRITKYNDTPIKDPAKEMLFTSNVLLTVPLKNNNVEKQNVSDKLLQEIKSILNEKQMYWYDHPIPVGIKTDKNEVIHGLKGLSQLLDFEKSKNNAKKNDKLNCLLSVSVTHKGLHRIAKEYITEEIIKSKSIKDLNIFIFTENVCEELVKEIIIPIAKKYLNSNKSHQENLLETIGVDGEYGRHYSFLKAITAFWNVFVSDDIKGTFKIDLDQVFPNEELVKQGYGSAFEHFKSNLWGATGKDAHANTVDLSFIAGALVNASDIKKSLFYPDIRFPKDHKINPDEYIFFSKLPQALSTESEMMEKYNSKEIDGKSIVLSRIHVTGGTNGILIKALRKYRPFTPSFIGRAEDQAYIMSVLFDDTQYLRYLHQSGLIMRHDKHSFAFEAIKAAESGKIIGDYLRILLFSFYANVLPWSKQRIKSELGPFTGCFISEIPFTLVYLRLSLLINHLFESKNPDDQEKAVGLMKTGIPRIWHLIKKIKDPENFLKQQYLKESQTWKLFYDILDIAENKIKNEDVWMLQLKHKAQQIINDTKID